MKRTDNTDFLLPLSKYIAFERATAELLHQLVQGITKWEPN